MRHDEEPSMFDPLDSSTTMTTPTRTYNSPFRKAEAAATRGRILDAAADLFASDGYALTSMRNIAERAQVSVQTVHLAGPKSAILLEAYERRIASIPRSVPSDEPATTAIVLDAIRLSTEINAVSAALWHAVDAASHADPKVREQFRGLIERHNQPLRAVLVALGVEGNRLETVTAELTFLMSPAAFLHFVGELGWSVSRFRGWLEENALRIVGARGD
jgi:AcrR family transcriptional regulator